MEQDNERSGLSSYYHQHPQHPLPPQTTISNSPSPSASASASASISIKVSVPSPTNEIPISSPNSNNQSTTNCVPSSGGASQMVFTQAHQSEVVSPLETEKKKRGRPRKYGTPELAAATERSSYSPVSLIKKRDHGFLASSPGGYLRKSPFSGPANAGQGFIPHVISVNPGEDVGQKIVSFMQQSNREICILSASGTVSSASLYQPATSGGGVTYEGKFEIVTLKGSYVRSEFGARTGGISVCLVNEGQILGGALRGPLIAAGPIQVILGSFILDTKKDMAGALKVNVPPSEMASPVGGASVSSPSFRSPVNSPHQSIGGAQFVLQPHVHGMQQQWNGGQNDMSTSQSMEWTGSSGHGMQSPEIGGYDHMPR